MHVLIVDDDQGFLVATRRLLELLDFQVTTAASIAEAEARIAAQSPFFDRVLIDLMLPDGSGLELLDSLFKADANVPVTIITGNPGVKALVKSLYGPNIDYLIKPITLEKLKTVFESEVGSSTGEAEQFHFGGLIGESAAMKELYEKISRVAKTQANVLLIGESGVGKEVVANAIHFVSENKGPFVACNCGAFSTELIGSELFGHEKGAFTGAVGKKDGIFEQGNGGTIFLDEITEMPLDMQPNLLRVLETKQFKRLGGTQTLAYDARVISSTNRSDQELIEGKVLREDLYFRLAVFPLAIPPLRQRKEDIPALSTYFLGMLNQEYNTQFRLKDADAIKLSQHDWPGNVRELRHFIHQAFIMTPENDEYLLIENVQSPLRVKAKETDQDEGIHPGRTIESVEKELILKTLEHNGGDKQNTADMLGISLKTLYNRLKSYEQES